MDKWLRLRQRKRFVNLAVRLFYRLIPYAEPKQPQTKALQEIYGKMYKAFSVETYCGRFDDVAFQRIASLKDKNFLRVLQASEKLLTYLAEEDRYYRGWLGLALLLSAEQVDKVTSSLHYLETLQSIQAQWEFPLHISKEQFDAYKPDMLEIAWTFGLWDLARFQFGKNLFQSNHEKKLK